MTLDSGDNCGSLCDNYLLVTCLKRYSKIKDKQFSESFRKPKRKKTKALHRSNASIKTIKVAQFATHGACSSVFKLNSHLITTQTIDFFSAQKLQCHVMRKQEHEKA